MPSRSGSRASRSIPQRNAASVLPEPVGAQISVLAPVAIAGQPAACAGVGPSKERSNQARVRSLNAARGSVAWVVSVGGSQPVDISDRRLLGPSAGGRR